LSKKRYTQTVLHVSNSEKIVDSVDSAEKNFIGIIKKKFHIVYWMIKNNIAIKNYSSLQNLINEVGENEQLKLFKHNSKSSFLDFMSIINDYCKETLIKSIKKFKLYSILVDSININNINQLSIYIRYINEDLNVKTSFLCIKEIGSEGATSLNLYKMVIQTLKEFNLDLENMVAFGSDGAANMRGDINGLCIQLKKDVKDLIDFHCALHRLNLTVRHTIKSIDDVNEVITMITEMVVYINKTSNRIQLFNYLQKTENNNKESIKIHKPVDIRWSTYFNTVFSFVKNFKIIQNFFEKEKQNHFLHFLQDDNFAEKSVIIDSILSKINDTF
jgi:hypothetical protein